MAKAASTRVASAYRLQLVFALHGLHNVRADGCDFVTAPGGPLRKIEVRWTRQQADAIFAVLAKYETAGLTHSPPAGQALAASDVYWQSVGDTLWVRDGGTALTVQFVTDAESDAYLPIGIALAKAVLPTVTAG